MYPVHASRTVPCNTLNKSPAFTHALKMTAGRQPTLENPMFSLLAAVSPCAVILPDLRSQVRLGQAGIDMSDKQFLGFGRRRSPLRKHKATLQHSVQGCSQTSTSYKTTGIIKHCTSRIIPLYHQIPIQKTPCCHPIAFRVTDTHRIFHLPS